MSTATHITPSSPLRVAFVVQGEGRGHMTQALALAGLLRTAGHQVVKVFLGRSHVRPVPRFFLDRIGAPVVTFTAPVQVPGRARRGVSVAATAANSLVRLPAFVASGVRIHLGLSPSDADVVVNFFDLVGSLSRVVLGARIPQVTVAHNYLFLHPALQPLPGRSLAQGAFLGLARATALRSDVRLALSYAPMRPDARWNLEVVPPLLRREVLALRPSPGEHLLAYALNPGYADVLADWHRRRGGPPFHCFVEGGTEALSRTPHPGFLAHDLDDHAFLELLASCSAYVGSAGFESLCEAFYLGKPVLTVPTEGQYEQILNVWDAERNGVARPGSYADLDAFVDAPARPEAPAVDAFRAWVAEAPHLHVRAVEDAALGMHRPA